jgi:S-adenosylmethionine:tRNA ribosyltransferase-isomerase
MLRPDPSLVSDFDFELLPELIAQHPLPERDASRMMIVSRKDGRIAHARFRDFPAYMNEGDLVVFNDTRVIPAKAWGKKGGADIEFLFVREREPGLWDVLCRPARKLKSGDRVEFGPGFAAEVAEVGEEGRRALRFDAPGVLERLRGIGFAPLPPYIRRRKSDAPLREDDLKRYQTIFAARDGAIAAPTAGLHFTPGVLSALEEKGILSTRVTLEVGPATFQPIRVERLADHRMLEETYEISASAAAAIAAAKGASRPVTAVGTTVVRALESAARLPAAESAGPVPAGRAATSIFIHPGFEFRVVDRLLTNFHLPKSTLLMLVAAFAGRDLILAAYREAVRDGYRFFSYGDCMLIT